MGRKHKYTTEVRMKYLKQGLQPCSKCDEVKPVSEFYRCNNKTASGTGYKAACKICTSGGTMKWTTKKRRALFLGGLQPCSKCNQIKALNQFTQDITTSTGYKGHCIDCQKEYRQGEQYEKGVKEYNNSDHYKNVVAKQYQETGAYRKNNSRYQSTEKGAAVQRAAQRKRRAKKKAVSENYTKADEQVTYDLFGQKCFRCGATDQLCIDHFLCLEAGHALTIMNAIPLCVPCNSSKGTKDPADYFTEAEMIIIKEKFKEAKDYV